MRTASRKVNGVLVIDVGGTHVKVMATGQREERRIPSGSTMTATMPNTSRICRRTLAWVTTGTRLWAALASGRRRPSRSVALRKPAAKRRR
jgi:hypothetical protein